MSDKTKVILKSFVYTALAAGASLLVKDLCPPAYVGTVGAGLAALLLNLRNAWHLPSA